MSFLFFLNERYTTPAEMAITLGLTDVIIFTG
jgi:hypothetical protein